MPTQSFRLCPHNDLDIIAWLNSQPSKTTAIKRALRREMRVSTRGNSLSTEDKDVLGDLVKAIERVEKKIARGVMFNTGEMEVEDDGEFDDVLDMIGR